ncbi:Os04g0589500, partial [Oryza sativa Japonica Group]
SFLSSSALQAAASSLVPAASRCPARLSAFVCLMASPASPREFTQEAARQSLIAISRSVPAAGEAVNIKSPSGAMVNGHHHDDDGAEKYRSKLISISNLSPDAQPTPCSPKDTAAA